MTKLGQKNGLTEISDSALPLTNQWVKLVIVADKIEQKFYGYINSVFFGELDWLESNQNGPTVKLFTGSASCGIQANPAWSNLKISRKD